MISFILLKATPIKVLQHEGICQSSKRLWAFLETKVLQNDNCYLTPGFQNSSANTTKLALDILRPALAAVMDKIATLISSFSWNFWQKMLRCSEFVFPSILIYLFSICKKHRNIQSLSSDIHAYTWTDINLQPSQEKKGQMSY